ALQRRCLAGDTARLPVAAEDCTRRARPGRPSAGLQRDLDQTPSALPLAAQAVCATGPPPCAAARRKAKTEGYPPAARSYLWKDADFAAGLWCWIRCAGRTLPSAACRRHVGLLPATPGSTRRLLRGKLGGPC